MPDLHLATLAVRAGQVRTAEAEHSEPIFTTSSYVFRSAADAAARFSEGEKGNIYSRFTNPTVRCFEERLAAMEGGAACVATASGMAAILSMCMALLKSGDHIVCSESVFGSTIGLINRYLVKFGVDVTYVRPDEIEPWRKAIRPNTKLFFLETPSNPLCAIGDIRGIADAAHANNIVLAVDNCFCTSALQRPIELGADLVNDPAGQAREKSGQRHYERREMYANPKRLAIRRSLNTQKNVSMRRSALQAVGHARSAFKSLMRRKIGKLHQDGSSMTALDLNPATRPTQ